MASGQKRRIEIIDIAKGIAIFMVILGHTSPNSELTGNPPMFTCILYAIHMPLFFFLSGMSISLRPLKSRKEWFAFLDKLILTIVVPYLIWALIYCKFNFTNVGWILYGSWRALGKADTLTSVWYLDCLFVSRILVQIAVNILEMRKHGYRLTYFIPAMICLIVGVLFPDIEIGYPWCCNVAFVAAGFIMLGIALKEELIKLSVHKGIVLIAMLIASCALFAVTVASMGERFTILLMCGGMYGDPLFALILALLGGLAVILLSMLLKRAADEWFPHMDLKPVIYLGQHTMGIFLIHKPMLQGIIMPAFSRLLSNGPDILVRVLSAITALAASLPVCFVVSHYAPALLGITGGKEITRQ